MKFVIGIDEAGRGPLAGPVTLGAFGGDSRVEKWILKNIFEDKLRDSKKLSPEKREGIYKIFLDLKKEKKIFFEVAHTSNKIIDKVGIAKAIKIGIEKVITPLAPLTLRGEENLININIRLDGLLKAPQEFKNQKTIIKGDEKDVFIACASIVAKVSRDRLMCRLAKKYPEYGFEIHKGYGTALHRNIIKKLGLSSIHRHSFCKNVEINL